MSRASQTPSQIEASRLFTQMKVLTPDIDALFFFAAGFAALDSPPPVPVVKLTFVDDFFFDEAAVEADAGVDYALVDEAAACFDSSFSRAKLFDSFCRALFRPLLTPGIAGILGILISFALLRKANS